MTITEIAVSIRSLHAITSGGRMRVLRCLTTRRMTSAEVSAVLRMRKSSAHKHLLRLARAGFVRRHDNGDRMWVYYSLTPEGRHLAQSERPRLVLLLSTALLLLTASAAFLAWRVYAWRNPDGEGTWGVDEIFPRPRPEFFSAGVVLAIALVLTTASIALPLLWRLRSRGRDDGGVDVGHEVDSAS